MASPTLLIVGGDDVGVIELNEIALQHLRAPKALEIVPGAAHLFPEPGALEKVIDYAAAWFETYLIKADIEISRRDSGSRSPQELIRLAKPAPAARSSRGQDRQRSGE